MSDKAFFEVKEKDVLGRIGVIETPHGKIETPAFAPVINPLKQIIPPSEILEMGFNLLMTNSFIILRRYGEYGEEIGVHKILGVESPVMTDSGAYQLMEYGYVDVSPEEIIKYQEKIGSDICIILDIPTRYYTSREQAVLEVEETIRRARRALAIREREDMLLLAPVQGGRHHDLVEYSARQLSQLPFEIYGIGGPTQIMEQYIFDELIQLVLTAKVNLPVSKPLHLFGAGHPMLLALMVALGVDTFDSASYILYAEKGRYMTPWGTYRIEDLKYFPCNCPTCRKHSPNDLKDMPKEEEVRLLAQHNLYALLSEINTIKQAIIEGDLWNLVEYRVSSHPKLKRAILKVEKYLPYIEEHSPLTRGKITGIFFLDNLSKNRVEVYRHRKKILSDYPLKGKKVALLLPETMEKPFHRFGPIARFYKRLLEEYRQLANKVEILVYAPLFGLIPIYIDDSYPLSQYEGPYTITENIADDAIHLIIEFIRRNLPTITALVVCWDDEKWGIDTGKKLEFELKKLGIKYRIIKCLPNEVDKEPCFDRIVGTIASLLFVK